MPELPKIIEDRYYHCVQNQKGDYDCVKKNSPTTPEEGKVSQLVCINKSIPEKLDPVILRHRLTPKVIIKS